MGRNKPNGLDGPNGPNGPNGPDRRTDRRTDGRSVGRTDGQSDGRTDSGPGRGLRSKLLALAAVRGPRSPAALAKPLGSASRQKTLLPAGFLFPSSPSGPQIAYDEFYIDFIWIYMNFC